MNTFKQEHGGTEEFSASGDRDGSRRSGGLRADSDDWVPGKKGSDVSQLLSNSRVQRTAYNALNFLRKESGNALDNCVSVIPSGRRARF